MKFKRFFIASFATLCCFSLNAIGKKDASLPIKSSPSITVLKEASEGFTEVAEIAIPSVVSIKVFFESVDNRDPYFNDFFYHFFGQMPQMTEPSVGFGSGFFITEDGYILTNNHLVKDATSLKVYLNDGREYDAKIIGSDPNTEVALIKVEGKNFPCLPLADSDKVKIGQWAIAIGNPFEFEASLTVGVVSAKGRKTNGSSWENYIQTDAPINPGNSGGPLLNIHGEVIGINTSILTRSGGYMGLGFAIPSNIAQHVADQLYKFGHIQRGYLGIKAQTLTPDLAEALKLPSHNGVVIVEICPNSPAEKAGLKEQDVILKVNQKPLTNQTNLTHEISLMKPGSKLTITVNRDGKIKEFEATVGDHPMDKGTETPIFTENALGIEVENLTDEYAKRLGYEHLNGVLITKVRPRSKMAMASVSPGTLIMSVNRKKINNTDDFYDALAEASQNKHILLLVRYGKISRYITINLK